jgi:hypothetical protein
LLSAGEALAVGHKKRDRCNMNKISTLIKLLLRKSFQVILLSSALFFVFGSCIWPRIIRAYMYDAYIIGFPLPIEDIGLCPPDNVCSAFNLLPVLLNFVFWVIIALLFSLLKVRKRELFLLILLFVILSAILLQLFPMETLNRIYDIKSRLY